MRRRPRPRLPFAVVARVSAWWRCAACGALNAGDRDAGFGCYASRPPSETPTSSTDQGATPPTG